MPRIVNAYDQRLLVLSLVLVLGGCSSVCQRCATDQQAKRTVSTAPSRAVQELLAQRTWAAFVERRAAHEARAMQVAAIDADHDQVTHLPRVSLQIGSPIALATAMQMVVAETGYSVVYGVGVDPQRPVSSTLVHQRLDAASDVLVRPLGYHAHLDTRDRQVQISALMTVRWRLPATEKDEAWWHAVRTSLEHTLASSEPIATTARDSTPMTQLTSTVVVDRTTESIVVSAPIPRIAVIDAYLSGLGAERLDQEE